MAFCEPGTVYPDKAILTEAKPVERNQMDELIDKIGVTYVFDRGYVDYGKFDQYSQRGILFVTRGKKQTTMFFGLIETTDLQGNLIRILSNRFYGEQENAVWNQVTCH